MRNPSQARFLKTGITDVHGNWPLLIPTWVDTDLAPQTIGRGPWQEAAPAKAGRDGVVADEPIVPPPAYRQTFTADLEHSGESAAGQVE